jgi:hypothetical protein
MEKPPGRLSFSTTPKTTTIGDGIQPGDQKRRDK